MKLTTIGLLILVLLSCSRSTIEKSNSTINLILDDTETLSASVTGKELLWRKSQIKMKDSTGNIQFSANVKDVDLIIIKPNNTYKSLVCYLEADQSLNVIYKAHQYTIVGNSIAARQNRFLAEIDHQRLSINSKKDTAIQTNYQSTQKLIDNFSDENKDASPLFLKFMQFDNRYFYLLHLMGKTLNTPKTYYHFTDQQLELLNNVIDDSNYDLAYLSPSYRTLLNDYMDYWRADTTKMISKPDRNPITNEKNLALRLKSQELREYQMAVSLKKLFDVDCGIDLVEAIKSNTGYWKNFLLEDYNESLERDNTARGLKNNIVSGFNITGTSYGSPFELKDYRGRWVYLVISKSEEGCSPYEAYYLKFLNERLPSLQCICASISSMKLEQKTLADGLLRVNIKEQELVDLFKSDKLPHSMLIDPRGNVILINLPTPSTGMLEPILRNIFADASVENLTK